MMGWVIAVFVATPIVVHRLTFDLAKGSTASAFLVGLFCACVTALKHPWGAAVFAFFLATFVQFVYAYCVGEVFRFFGGTARKSFQDAAKAKPVRGHRLVISGAGGIVIFLTVAVGSIAMRLETGAWPDMPPKAFAGFLAFFFIGLLFVAVGIEQRRQERANSHRCLK